MTAMHSVQAPLLEESMPVSSVPTDASLSKSALQNSGVNRDSGHLCQELNSLSTEQDTDQRYATSRSLTTSMTSINSMKQTREAAGIRANNKTGTFEATSSSAGSRGGSSQRDIDGRRWERQVSSVDPLDTSAGVLPLDDTSFHSVKETDSYFIGVDEEENKVLLNNVSRKSSRPMVKSKSTHDSIRQVPFHPGKHARIIPMHSNSSSSRSSSTASIASLPLPHNKASSRSGSHSRPRLINSPSNVPVPSTSNHGNLPMENESSSKEELVHSLNSLNLHQHATKYINDGDLKRSESAAFEIQKMRQSLLQKREMRRKQKRFLDDDRVLVGNKVTEGHVNFIIAYNMLTGIRVAVSRCSGIMKPLIDTDFKFTKKLAFDYHGNELTPSSQYAFKFKDYCPEVFRELRAVFGLDPADYLMSLTSKYILSELNSPGKSGSFFYYSRDYKYIIKTIHHSEHKHLRRILPRYYMHVKENPDTLISQFYGLHRIKMPISFRSKIKHRKIYFLVMNNLFPPHLQIHTTFDLKGSTWGRYTDCNENDDPQHNPVLKDLNWLEQKQSIKFGPLKSKKFLQQIEKDVKLLSELNIMDYSLLVGIHNIEKANDLIDDGKDDYTVIPDDQTLMPNLIPNQNLKRTSTHRHYHRHTHHSISQLANQTQVVKHFFQQDEGGIRASDRFNHDLNQIYFIGIIDCLTNYSIIKKLETLWRGINHDLKAVSAVPPKLYADRFYHFIEGSVNKQYYEDNPEEIPYND